MYGIIPGFSNGVEANAVIGGCAAAGDQRQHHRHLCRLQLSLVGVRRDLSHSGERRDRSICAPNATFVPAPPLINAAGGIQVGDLIMLSNSLGTAVGEVTNLTPGSITFADARCAEHQSEWRGAEQYQGHLRRGEHDGVSPVCGDLLPDGSGDGETPRLMRQVNGLELRSRWPTTSSICNSPTTPTTQANGALDANQANPIWAWPNRPI